MIFVPREEVLPDQVFVRPCYSGGHRAAIFSRSQKPTLSRGYKLQRPELSNLSPGGGNGPLASVSAIFVFSPPFLSHIQRADIRPY